MGTGKVSNGAGRNAPRNVTGIETPETVSQGHQGSGRNNPEKDGRDHGKPGDVGTRRRLWASPRDWALWSQPRGVIVYHLAVEAVVLAGVTYVLLTAVVPDLLDWFRFAVLTVCATIHIQLSRRQEERRRNQKIKPQVYVDLTSIWSVPAVLVLPIQLTLLLIVVSRAQRWFVARRQPHRFVFAVASMLMAATLAHAILLALAPTDWSRHDLVGSIGSVRDFGVLILAGLVYGAVQAGNIGGVLALASPTPTLRTVLGSKDDNQLEAVTIALGVVSAILLVTMPAALVIMIVLSVLGNRIAEVRQLQVDVRMDPKTGLLNMRAWREAAAREIGRAGRATMPVALLMIDLDHFKSINDTWGHPAGDDVLAQVADALRAETRPTDLVGRFGGEEFVGLLPDADTDNALAAAERIRRRIAALEVITTDKRGGPVTITHRTTSVGLAVYPHHATALDQLLRAADTAVYEAKERGRDQVRLAAAPPVHPGDTASGKNGNRSGGKGHEDDSSGAHHGR